MHSNDFGIRCIIAPSFAEIFRTNTLQNGMLPVALLPDECKLLYDDAMACKQLEVDLEKQEVRREAGDPIKFSVDPFRRHCLLNGLDDIGLTMQKNAAINAFEQRRSDAWPWLDGFAYVQGRKIPASVAKVGQKFDW